VSLDQPAAGRSARAYGLVGTVLAAELDAELLGEPLDGLGEGEAVDLHHEGDDVAALPAAEAVEELPRRVDVERRSLLVVEGTQALERPTAGGLEGDVAGDHVVDPRLLAHLGDVLVANPACHARESTGALPRSRLRLPNPATGRAATPWGVRGWCAAAEFGRLGERAVHGLGRAPPR
jgi:hypothetical protein